MSDWLDVLNDEQRNAVEQTEGYVCYMLVQERVRLEP